MRKADSLEKGESLLRIAHEAAEGIYRSLARVGQVPPLKPGHRPRRSSDVARETAWMRSAGVKLAKIGAYVERATTRARAGLASNQAGGSSKKTLERLAAAYIKQGRKEVAAEIKTIEEFNGARGRTQYVLRGKWKSQRALSAREQLGRLEVYLHEALQNWFDGETRIKSRLLTWPPKPAQIRRALRKLPQATLVYTGPHHGGIDLPDFGIYEWKPGEQRSVPTDLAQELLQRGTEFRVAAGNLLARKEGEQSV